MIHLSNSARRRLALLIVLAGTIVPARSFAELPDTGSVLDYSIKGFTLGAETGLAVGYLSTGTHYDHYEWRKLVLGAGIGALAGLTTGIIISIADASEGAVPIGYYMLRDSTYGTLIGALMGGLVGALLWVDDGSSRDVLQGAAYGTLFGAVAGIAFGIVEGNSAPDYDRRRRGRDWRVGLSPVGNGRSGLAASLSGVF
jgi:hypothetical protein